MRAFSDKIEFSEIRGRRIATVERAGDERSIVLCCHGFRGSKIGPSRSFVRLARRLQSVGIGSLRFDQYGSGDSEGEFLDSSFDDWVATMKELADLRLAAGYQVALLGQSMGGSAVLVAAADLGKQISSVVAWVPDPSINPPSEAGSFHKEGGERVDWRFWREAHDANIVDRFRAIPGPALVFFAENDDYVSIESRDALSAVPRPHQRIVLLRGHSHSGWTFAQADRVIAESVDFLVANFRRR
jgi:uncharacterized protein